MTWSISLRSFLRLSSFFKAPPLCVCPPVVPLADYYIIAGVVYQAPDLGTVISSRVVNKCVLLSRLLEKVLLFIRIVSLQLSAVHGIQSAFDEAMSYCRYHPSKGYWWHFKDQEERGLAFCDVLVVGVGR